MELTRRLDAYIRLVRPKTVISTILAAIGGSFYAGNPLEYSSIHIPLMVITGVTLAHFSINALNDYIDYKSGLDLRAPRTPFSGGSKVLVDNIITPIEALLITLTSLSLAFIIGLYLTLYRGLLVLILAITGALIITTYNKILVKIYLGEIAVWIKGVLVFIGTLYTITGFISLQAIVVGLIYGNVSTLVLYANFIPDIEADRLAGRRNLPILLGGKAWLGYLLLSLTLTLILILSTILNLLNPLALLALAPLTLTPKVSYKLKTYKEFKELIEALALNVKMCRSVDIIVTIAIIANAFL